MLITPSFNKSLIVEQFQGIYLKWNSGKMLLAVLAFSSWLSKIIVKIMYCNFA